MIFHRSRIKPNVINRVVIDNHHLIQVNSTKYLGVIIDHKLNWIEHISYVKSKMSKGIRIMYKARQFLTKKALLMWYHAYIYRYMTYCIEVWGCASQTQLNFLFLFHEHNTRGCHQLRVLHGAKTFSNISARIWNVLTNKFNCDVSMSIFKCKLKLFLLHNELVLNYPK